MAYLDPSEAPFLRTWAQYSQSLLRAGLVAGLVQTHSDALAEVKVVYRASESPAQRSYCGFRCAEFVQEPLSWIPDEAISPPGHRLCLNRAPTCCSRIVHDRIDGNLRGVWLSESAQRRCWVGKVVESDRRRSLADRFGNR